MPRIIAIKEVGEPLRFEYTDKKYRTECVQEYIGKENYTEFVSLSSDRLFSLGVDEEGLPKELPVNFFIATHSKHFPIQKMVGTVVFTRVKPVDGLQEIWDYELDDLRIDDAISLLSILDNGYQKYLESTFNDYGKGHVVLEKIF